jgi:hypothetical protein
MNISIELINAILGYLGNKPYAEVVNLITAIQAEAGKAQAPTEQPKE